MVSTWSQVGETHLHKQQVPQNRTLRLMFFTNPRVHAVALFLETKYLPISFLMLEQINLLLYNVHNNFACGNIKNMFKKLSLVRICRTISVTNENYCVQQTRTENMKQSYFPCPDLEQHSTLSKHAFNNNQLKANWTSNSLKYWKKRTTTLLFLFRPAWKSLR